MVTSASYPNHHTVQVVLSFLALCFHARERQWRGPGRHGTFRSSLMNAGPGPHIALRQAIVLGP